MSALTWSGDVSFEGLVLRQAAPADAQGVAALMAEADVEQWWHQAWPADRWAECLTGLVQDPDSLPLTLVDNGGAVGYVEVYRVATDVLGEHIAHSPTDLGMHLALGERARGRGLGARLIRAVLNRAPDILEGCQRLVAEPDITNIRSHRAFETAGFTAVDIVRLPDKTAVLLAADPDAADPEGRSARKDTSISEGALP